MRAPPSAPATTAFDLGRVPLPRQPVFEDHRARVKTVDERLVRLDRRGALLANLRAGTFLGAAAFAVLAVFERLPGWGYAASLGFLFAYALFAAIHHRVLTEEERQRLLRALSVRALQRLTHQWTSLPEDGASYLDGSHLYAPDLDIFGHGSLFQLLDETATRSGEARLAQWLAAPAVASVVEERQAAVKELAPRVDFRHELLVEARRVAERKADPRAFILWAETSDVLTPLRWARPVAWALPLTTLALYLLGRFDVLPRSWFWGGLLLQLAVIVLTRRRLGAFYERLSAGEQGFVRYEGAFRALEKEPLQTLRLVELQRGLQQGRGEPVSKTLGRFGRLFGFAELRQSAQLHAVIHLLTLWDLHWLFRLDAWRQAHGAQLRGWFDALAEVEALLSLAAFTHEHPDYTFARVSPEGPRFVAKALGHPLLEQPVANDVAFERAGEGIILTGSNMSGKTTLLRAIGVNAVLAQLGAPVCAASLELSELRVVTSMRVKDSLERGVSYFYAEVQRMKAVLDAAQKCPRRTLFLLDEILLGTNTRERQLASRGLLRLLLETGAMGAVTTHDLTLTTMEGEAEAESKEQPSVRIRNFHFRDQLVKDEMSFDYQLRPGVVETTNALRVLKLAGIDLPGTG